MKKTYIVTITETLSRQIEVSAENSDAAIDKIHEAYHDGDIVLSMPMTMREPIFRSPSSISNLKQRKVRKPLAGHQRLFLCAEARKGGHHGY